MTEISTQNPTADPPARGARRTQAERSAATRNAILEATLFCLVDRGYAAASTGVIQQRAGVSRGALTHQFPSKSELMIAAVRYLSALRSARLLGRLADAPAEGDRTAWLFRVLWEQGFDSDLFQAAIELWTAARTEPKLRAALQEAEHALGREHREGFALALGDPIARQPNFRRAYEAVVQQMRGAALAKLVRMEKKASDELIAECLRIFRNELNRPIL